MKKTIFLMAALFCSHSVLFAQKVQPDSLKTVVTKKVVVTANRQPVTLLRNPGAVSLVNKEDLSVAPKTIGAEEALRLVPGVRVENQHGGERVHLAIRGQGILTERGLRGIGVMVDGIPLNDPSGFAPDLYDVDWATVKNIEVLRGPNAGLYGGSSSGGVLNIFTKDGDNKPIGGELSQIGGSNDFRKSLVQLGGTNGDLNYRASFSRTDGDGYRDHQAYWGNNLYEKISYNPSEKLSIMQIFSHTDYFHQNPEGLNLEQFDNLMQANPDANPFNEYQKTRRNTFGLTGQYKFNDANDLALSAYLRSWDYKETSNKYAEYRDISNPGASVQYNLHLSSGELQNHFSIGADYKRQDINMYKLESGSDPDREESTDETNVETNNLLANQIIEQQNAGVFFMYKMDYGKFTLLGNARYDDMQNTLTDKMLGADSSETSKDFSKSSLRLGGSYNFSDNFTLFANWSQGFIPPSTEELASNPVGYSGFNTHLEPATSNCIDLGARGIISDGLYYEITGFLMNTDNDFFRFKQSGRGNQEVFYGNAGNSRRLGIEAFLSYNILENLSLQMSYTYADYKYTSATVDPIYLDKDYVLTSPPAEDQWLPNSPQHQLYAEITYSPIEMLKLNLGAEYQSKWAIYTDPSAYNGLLDANIYQNWQDGFTLLNAKASYTILVSGLPVELGVAARNITDKEFIAFTEPDPDGNSYQPGAGREFFGTIKINF